eukprot:scaffold10.g2468.t1
MVTIKEGETHSGKGLRLFTASFFPDGDPKAVLLFHHGLAEHIGRYKKIFTSWAEAGIAVFAEDAFGHGKSEGPRALVMNFDDLVDDFDALSHAAQHACTEHYPGAPDLPYFVGGHSLGGLVATALALRDQSRWAGLLVLSPAMDMEWTLSLKLQAAVGNLLAALVPRARIVPAVRPEDMNPDPACVQEYVTDPLNTVGNVCARTANETLKTMVRVRKRWHEVSLPLYAHHGMQDKCTSAPATRALVQAAASSDKVFHHIEGGYHEVMLSPGGDKIAAQVADWILAHARGVSASGGDPSSRIHAVGAIVVPLSRSRSKVEVGRVALRGRRLDESVTAIVSTNAGQTCSSLMNVACAGCDGNCGLASRVRLYDEGASASAQLGSCASGPCAYICEHYGCGSCRSANKSAGECSFTVLYGDGSGARGRAVSDSVRFSAHGKAFTNIVFGCATTSLPGLYTRRAQGLIGLEMAPPSPLVQMQDQGIDAALSFCLGGNDSSRLRGRSLPPYPTQKVLGSELPISPRLGLMEAELLMADEVTALRGSATPRSNRAGYWALVESLSVGDPDAPSARFTMNQPFLVDTGATLVQLPSSSRPPRRARSRLARRAIPAAPPARRSKRFADALTASLPPWITHVAPGALPSSVNVNVPAPDPLAPADIDCWYDRALFSSRQTVEHTAADLVAAFPTVVFTLRPGVGVGWPASLYLWPVATDDSGRDAPLMCGGWRPSEDGTYVLGDSFLEGSSESPFGASMGEAPPLQPSTGGFRSSSHSIMSGAAALDRVGRALYRSLIRSASKFDRHPALKARQRSTCRCGTALICRNVGVPLPAPLDEVVAAFLGGLHRSYYWPSPTQAGPRTCVACQAPGHPLPAQRIPCLPGADQLTRRRLPLSAPPPLPPPTRRAQGPRSVVGAVRAAFRFSPEEEPTLESAFMGLRYLSGLLGIAERHSMLASAAPAAAAAGEGGGICAAAGPAAPGARWWETAAAGGAGAPALDPASLPSKGAVLLAHPSLGGWFARSVVLLCAHDGVGGAGSYGLTLNKPIGGDVRQLSDRVAAATAAGAGAGGSERGAALQAEKALLIQELVGEAAAALSSIEGDDSSSSSSDGSSGSVGGAGAEDVQGLAAAAPGLGTMGVPPGGALPPPPAAAVGDVPAELLQEVVDGLAWEQQQAEAEARGLVGAWGGEEDAREMDEEEALAAQAAFSALLDHPEMEQEIREALMELDSEFGDEEEGDWQGFDSHSDADADAFDAAFSEAMSGGGAVVLVDSEGTVFLRSMAPPVPPEPDVEFTYELPPPHKRGGEGEPWKAAARDAEAGGGAEAGAEARTASSSPEACDQTVAERALGMVSQAMGRWAPMVKRGFLGGRAGAGSECAGASSSSSSADMSEPGRADAGAVPSGVAEAAAAASLEGQGEPGEGDTDAAEAANSAAGATTFVILSTLFHGSPVLHCCAALGGERVLPPSGRGAGVFMGARIGEAANLIRQDLISMDDIKIFIGDAGWGPQQLQAEVETGTWVVVRPDPSFLDLFPDTTARATAGGTAAAGTSNNAAGGNGPSGATAGAAAAEAAAGAGELDPVRYENEEWARHLRALGGEFAAMAAVPRGVWADLVQLQV